MAAIHEPLKIMNDPTVGLVGRQQTTTELDYVKDGILHRGANAPIVQITSNDDLTDISDIYPVGTIAYTAGWKAAWQLDANGLWVRMV